MLTGVWVGEPAGDEGGVAGLGMAFWGRADWTERTDLVGEALGNLFLEGFVFVEGHGGDLVHVVVAVGGEAAEEGDAAATAGGGDLGEGGGGVGEVAVLFV